MAIVKATYTKSRKTAKASIRYIEHRPGKDGQTLTRTLFGIEGKMERQDAYTLIDEAKKGSVFFHFVISPDPSREDSGQDLQLRDITEQTMQILSDRFQTPIAWVGVVHADHAPHRHVHVVAMIDGKLIPRDFTRLRERATDACLTQRRERDYVLEQQSLTERQSRAGGEGEIRGR